MAYEIKQDGAKFFAADIVNVQLLYPKPRSGQPFMVVVYAPKGIFFKRPTVTEARAVAARISDLWAKHG